MQSYKIKKMTETSMFPIEYEIRKMRDENSSNWFRLMWQLTSVVFSGCATTLLCQNNYIPSLFDKLTNMLPMPAFLRYIFEILFILLVFIGLVSFTYFVIKNKVKVKDNKANELSRARLAEYFHKVIFNNITTGRSFLKKSSSCSGKEKELYLCEALYYFILAYKDIKEKDIIEVGERKSYVLFLKEVGKSVLKDTIDILKDSIYILISQLPNPEKGIAEDIYKDIVGWII